MENNKTNFAISTTEKRYEKAYNDFYKLFSINKNYRLKLHGKTFTDIRYLLPVKIIEGRVICYGITSKKKNICEASFFPASDNNKINSWIMFEPLIIPHTSLNAKKNIIIDYEMIEKHFANLKKHSTDENPYLDYFNKTIDYLIEISNDNYKKIKQDLKQELFFLNKLPKK